MTTASVIVNNFNYARYVGAAIDSALAQTHPATEVIVVDDGSTDESREIIASYGDRLRAALKDNGGQGSAFNAGFAASTGDVVCFLDADDVLDPDAMERAVAALAGGAAKVHWPLRELNLHGEWRGDALRPPGDLCRGDLRAKIAADGSESYVTVPTSGNAWARWALERVLPLDERRYHMFADGYLCTLVPLYGPVAAIDEPLGGYRRHGGNHSGGRWLQDGLRYWETMADDLEAHCHALGLTPDRERWQRRSWYPRVRATVDALAGLGREGRPFVLVDDSVLAEQLGAGGIAMELIQRGGVGGGAPLDDEEALAALHERCAEGAAALVIAWPAFWWRDTYPEFIGTVARRYPCVADDDLLLAFDLRAGIA
jgi:glycosyltransferase involved in cell wall biosynthesis